MGEWEGLGGEAGCIVGVQQEEAEPEMGEVFYSSILRGQAVNCE